MKGTLKACLGLLLALPAWAGLQQSDLDTAKALRDQALAGNIAYDTVESLTVEVGPRLAGSEGDRKAVAWAVDKLQRLGFDRVYTEELAIPTWRRGHIHAEISAPYRQHLVITALGGSVGTGEKGLAGDIAFFETLDELKAADPKAVEGKIVFINKRMERAQTGFQYGKTVAGRSKGAIEAAKKGAQAILIRSVGTGPHRFAHTGTMKYEEGVPRIPAAAVAVPDANLVEAMHRRGKTVSVHLEMTAEPGPQGKTHNVIAELTGSEKPEEVVLIGAHLDSWDNGPGALDDGAGVGIMVAAGKLIEQLPQRPKRTIRVVLYGAEEIGLYGGHAYAERHREELAKHVLAGESDFGAGAIYRLDTNFGPEGRALAKALFEVLEPMGVAAGNNEAGGGPDVSMLPELGVPVVSPRQDGTYYFDYHHTPDDTLNKIVPEELNQNVATWTVIAYLAAQYDGSLRPVKVK
ncbi:M28 family peptidase [Gallaecimonas sp. GXIMD4217]|uniref:M28 family peptidase n=1 Tax=Gallaecimonas sp. GXIMD4217 TaxID=3131927 RepID=UPI00311AFF28